MKQEFEWKEFIKFVAVAAMEKVNSRKEFLFIRFHSVF